MADNNGQGRLGQWTYPDGSVLLGNAASYHAGQQFYVNRNSGQIIGLNRREAYNPLTPTGSYCCTIPTSGNKYYHCIPYISQPVCVHLLYEFMKLSQLFISLPPTQLHQYVLIISRPSLLMEA